MGDTIEAFRDMKEFRKAFRRVHGVDCPNCPKNRSPTRLLPGQRCKVDGYRDSRNRHDPKYDEAEGWKRVR